MREGVLCLTFGGRRDNCRQAMLQETKNTVHCVAFGAILAVEVGFDVNCTTEDSRVRGRRGKQLTCVKSPGLTFRSRAVFHPTSLTMSMNW